MADAGAWYGTTGGGIDASWSGGHSYTQGVPKRHADPAARAKRSAARKRKNKAAKKARRANRG